jgi:hypothetical protein
MKIGRNDPCPCGSGQKHKHCCLDKKRSPSIYQKLLLAVVILILAGGLIRAFVSFRGLEPGPGPGQSPGQGQGKVWSEEHQHWH